MVKYVRCWSGGGGPSHPRFWRYRARAIALTLALVATTIAAPPAISQTVPSGPQSGLYLDTPPGSSQTIAIGLLDDMGILEGTECHPRRFCPQQSLARWEMAVWLYRAFGEDVEPGTEGDNFADVEGDLWWSGYVHGLAELGITKGCASDPLRFCPFDSVSRGEVATFVSRALELSAAEDVDLADVDGTVHAPHIRSAYASGLIEGCSAESLRYCPYRTITRGEMAQVLARSMGLVPSLAYETLVKEHGIDHLIARYTTYHDCCEPRVSNLHLFAEAVDGAVVAPGEQMSLNRTVGRRTTEKGYRPAPTWVVDRLVDTVGGGISQYAATIYNASFWGGLVGSYSRPHSTYISRYPAGIEGTLDFPYIDMILANDLDSPIMVVNQFDDTSLTVSLYGNNDGRMVVGEWKDGKNTIEVLAQGGPTARVVIGAVSERFDHTEPPATEYIPNSDLAVGELVLIQEARRGWTVQVSRTVQMGDDPVSESWRVRYSPVKGIVEAHPCVITDECPPPSSLWTIPE